MQGIRGFVFMVALAVGATAGATDRQKVTLSATTAAPTARGRAAIVVPRATDGKFDVRVQKLIPSTAYDLLVGGIKVASIQTNAGGSGRVRFSSRPRGRDLLLGFDPRGEAIEVRQASGDDVLTGNLPAGLTSTPDVTCCIPDDSGSECEDRTEAACLAAGGTVVVNESCLPNPCGATPPVDADVVCCIPHDSTPECEDRTQAECLAAGGSIVQATSCDPNPCAAPPPPPGDDIQCCVPAYYVWLCEARTVAECSAVGGINKGPGMCSPNPCGGLPPSEGHGICCQPNLAGDEIECEDRTVTECAALGGVAKGNGVCTPDTCADVLPPNPDVQCCLPSGNDFECEDRTAAQCAAEGGISMGTGTCLPDPCVGLVPTTTTTTVAPGGTTTTTVPGGGGGSAGVLVSCERRVDRSRASVNGTNLIPGTYQARLLSGGNVATTPTAASIGDEVEFDLDSDPDNIAAGATAIAEAFLVGAPPTATGQLLDASGAVVAESTVVCSEQ